MGECRVDFSENTLQLREVETEGSGRGLYVVLIRHSPGETARARITFVPLVFQYVNASKWRYYVTCPL